MENASVILFICQLSTTIIYYWLPYISPLSIINQQQDSQLRPIGGVGFEGVHLNPPIGLQ